MEEWKPEEVEAHLNYYRALSRELEASGELAQTEVLAGPDLAKIVTSDGSATVVTDGPFQEFKEWVAGFQIVDVESEERALEIAARLSAVPGPGRRAGPAADPRAAGDGGRAQGRRRDGELPPDGGRRALNVPRRSRGPAARAGAAGPRHARPPARRLRRRRGRGAGGADRGGRALAEGRHPGKPARLAAPDSANGGWSTRGEASGRGGSARRSRAREPAAPEVSAEDDTLAVLFMCCHPALTDASAIALTLRAVGGLTTSRDRKRVPRARGDDGAAHRRAKQRIRASGVPFRMPAADERRGAGRPGAARPLPHLQRGLREQQRAASCSAPSCRRRRSGWRGWSQRLLPDDGEVTGLLALMLLIDARRPARTDAAGDLVPLARAGPLAVGIAARIAEGTALLNSALGTEAAGRVPAPGGDRGGPRSRRDRRGDRLAADPRAVRAARAE